MPSNHLILYHSLLLLPSFFSPASESFQMSRLFASGGQCIEASASLLPVTIQGWFPLGLTDFVSLWSFSRTSAPSPALIIHIRTRTATRVCLWTSVWCQYLFKIYTRQIDCRQLPHFSLSRTVCSRWVSMYWLRYKWLWGNTTPFSVPLFFMWKITGKDEFCMQFVLFSH